MVAGKVTFPHYPPRTSKIRVACLYVYQRNVCIYIHKIGPPWELDDAVHKDVYMCILSHMHFHSAHSPALAVVFFQEPKGQWVEPVVLLADFGNAQRGVSDAGMITIPMAGPLAGQCGSLGRCR